MAQTPDSPPPQTSHVESEQTTSEWLRKLPTQVNTQNIFVPDLALQMLQTSNGWTGVFLPLASSDSDRDSDRDSEL